MKRNKRFDKSLIILFLIILVTGVTSIILFLQSRTDRITEEINKDNPIKIVFFISEKNNLLLSEVVFYHPATGKGAILDMPGEVGSLIKSINKIDRIDTLYRRGDVEPIIEKFEELTGTELPYYIDIEIDNVEKLVDLIEGIEMFIANPVEIIEEDKMVLLPAGSVLLDGNKTKTFLTYEEQTGVSDIDKTGRKQKFIQSLLTRMGEKEKLLENDNVFNYFRSYIDTNLDRRALISFIKEIKKLDGERMVFQRVLGVSRKVDDQQLIFPHYEGNLLRETVKQTLESLAKVELASGENPTIKVEILNGTNRDGLASRTSQLFKNFGYDVVNIGNADHFGYEQTQIIARAGDISKAQKVANFINCKRIIPDDDTKKVAGLESSEQIDVTVILGMDFDGRYCKN
ncbi:MAG: LytR family transcriptional regulator [Spirochaetes bacterium]|nr:MAG: LytR family transcriptional regulator [Spirochaetota bacterium]